MAELNFDPPVTNQNVGRAVDEIFAPWVKAMGLRDIEVSEGKASATLPQNPELQWANGAICGQAIMAAVARQIVMLAQIGEAQRAIVFHVVVA